MITMTAIIMVLLAMNWILAIISFPSVKMPMRQQISLGAQISLALKENVQYPADPYTGAAVSNKMTGTGAVDGVGIDGTDSGQYINYMTRSNFDETFPKTPVKSRLLPKKNCSF